MWVLSQRMWFKTVKQWPTFSDALTSWQLEHPSNDLPGPFFLMILIALLRKRESIWQSLFVLAAKSVVIFCCKERNFNANEEIPHFCTVLCEEGRVHVHLKRDGNVHSFAPDPHLGVVMTIKEIQILQALIWRKRVHHCTGHLETVLDLHPAPAN